MSAEAKYSDAMFFKKLFVRYILIYISFGISSTVFSNWRFFPSLDLGVFVENWGKFIFYTLWVGLPYLFLAQIISVLLSVRFQVRYNYLADVVFVAFFLISPVSLVLGILSYDSVSTFSFGVSEGEIIKNNVVTALGRKYFFMHKMMALLHMLVYLALRIIIGRPYFGKMFKLSASS